MVNSEKLRNRKIEENFARGFWVPSYFSISRFFYFSKISRQRNFWGVREWAVRSHSLGKLKEET